MTDPLQKWPTNLVIVRHAESQRNIWKEIATAAGELVYGGEIRDMDVPLTDNGRGQAFSTGVLIGKILGAEPEFDRVYASPYLRTMHTAQLMCEQFPYSVEIVAEERLREQDFGLLDGLTKHGIAHRYPDEAARKAKVGKYHFRPCGGESWSDVALRVHSFLETLTREMAGGSVLIVSHSVVVTVFRKLLERLSEAQVMAIDADKSMDVANCSVTHYSFEPGAGENGKLVLRVYNRTAEQVTEEFMQSWRRAVLKNSKELNEELRLGEEQGRLPKEFGSS